MRPVYAILGHANAALAILLDALHSRHGAEVAVEIVSNIRPEENPFHDLTFRHPDITTRELFHSGWNPSGNERCLLGAMSPKTKRIVRDFFAERFALPDSAYESLVHASSVLCHEIRMGHGCNISPLVTLAPFAELGNFVTLNRNVSIGHHTVLEDFVSINPGCHIAGLCRLREGVQVGLGSTLVDRVEIGAGAIVGAGSLVTKDVPPATLVMGAPARVVRDLEP